MLGSTPGSTRFSQQLGNLNIAFVHSQAAEATY